MLNEKNKTVQFNAFFLKMYPKAKLFALKILKNEADAEDLTQDVFARLWDHPEIWNDRDIADAYVFTMVKNAIFNFLKHKKIEQKYASASEAVDISDICPDDIVYAREINLIARITLDSMPEQRKMAFILSRVNGLSNKEIAEKMGLSVRTVERHIYLALQMLKQNILFFFIFLSFALSRWV